jgi:hypothetical protein
VSVFFLGGLIGFSCGFWGICWVGASLGLVWVFDGASTVFWDLGFMWVLGVMSALVHVGFLGSVLWVGWVVPVYLGAPYAF